MTAEFKNNSLKHWVEGYCFDRFPQQLNLKGFCSITQRSLNDYKTCPNFCYFGTTMTLEETENQERGNGYHQSVQLFYLSHFNTR